MTDAGTGELIRANALALLDEIFREVHGAMLDKPEPLFSTVAEISAEQASVVHAPGTGSIAAHVDHIAFYIHVSLDDVQGADWSQSWTISNVTEEEWATLNANLRAAYDRVMAEVQGYQQWTDWEIGNTMAIVGHTAFHLGQIREIMATFRP